MKLWNKRKMHQTNISLPRSNKASSGCLKLSTQWKKSTSQSSVLRSIIKERAYRSLFGLRMRSVCVGVSSKRRFCGAHVAHTVTGRAGSRRRLEAGDEGTAAAECGVQCQTSVMCTCASPKSGQGSACKKANIILIT